MGFGFAFDTGFNIVFPAIMVLVVGIFVYALVMGMREWTKNNGSPRLSVEAVLMSKRQNTTHHTSGGHHHTGTTYYATFQVESGDRLELRVSGKEYGQLAEGDSGKLHFQGSRYLGFDRDGQA